MALATGQRQYTPPRRIRQMESDLAPLASLWAGTRFEGPWGWSHATKQHYIQMGFPPAELPTDDWLDGVRRLSSRQFATEYIHTLLATLDDERLLGREMRFHTDLNFPQDGARIFKSPWSSSGRGVFTSTGLTDEQVCNRLRGFLRTQGGYLSDHFYADKQTDLAMEFFVNNDHTVDFLGYSVFHAEESGAYAYNVVDSQQALLQLINCDPQLLNSLIEYHKTHLSRTPYHGPVGIDMLLAGRGKPTSCTLPNCKHPNRQLLHPCLEINFRMNMGILAILLYEKYGPQATVQLTPLVESGFEARIENGRLSITYKPAQP